MTILLNIIVLWAVFVLSCVFCDNPSKDYLYIRHISSSEQRELRRLCDEGDLLTFVKAMSIQMTNSTDYLCHKTRFIGHYWVKMEDLQELLSHDDISSSHVTLSDEEFIAMREGSFCKVNLTADMNCTPLSNEGWTKGNASIEILIKFSKYPITGSYESLRTYVIILIVVLMCCTFTAVVHVTQKSVSEWQKKLTHQYIFVVDNK